MIVQLGLLAGTTFMLHYTLSHMISLYTAWSESKKLMGTRVLNLGILSTDRQTCDEGLYCDDDESYIDSNAATDEEYRRLYNRDVVRNKMITKDGTFAQELITSDMKDVLSMKEKHGLDKVVYKMPVVENEDGDVMVDDTRTTDVITSNKDNDDYVYDRNKDNTAFWEYVLSNSQYHTSKRNKEKQLEALKKRVDQLESNSS